MASLASLEDRFNAAVKTIQTLPANGPLQPNNITKLIFYGLYKQATVGPCKDAKPSMFNYINRAKWEAWDRYRLMTKEQAMLTYIDEIRKVVETMPQTNEVLEFSQLIGLSNESIDEQSKENNSAAVIENKEARFESFANEDDQKETPLPTQTLVLSSSSSVSSSSISTSDIDEFYDDPSDLLIVNYDEITSNNNNIQQQSRLQHSNVSSTHSSSLRHHDLTKNYNKQTQRAILTALTKLQRDMNNILERLNRLETSAYLLQQRELIASSELDSSSRWLPLSGFRRGAIAFILLWPFVVFLLIRLYFRARIIIRFRRQRL